MDPSSAPRGPVVIYHAACPDGSAAAVAAYLKLGEEATYLAISYGQEPPSRQLLEGRRVYVLDFCFEPSVVEGLLAICDLTILDHHKTHAEAFAGNDHGGRVLFDLEHSGAVLAYRHFFPGQSVPEFFRYVEDRDLWRWAMPDSRAITAALRAVGGQRKFRKYLPVVEGWGPEMKERMVAEGASLLKLQDQLIASMVSKAELVELDGVRALAANATVLFSEVAEALWLRQPPMGIAFFWDGQRHRFQVSLRSQPGFDVSGIAQRLGGGGHPQAAAFLCSALPWRHVGPADPA